MKRAGDLSNAFRDGAGRRGDDLLTGRLGSELTLIYHDTLQAALPPRLQAIVNRLEEALRCDRAAEEERTTSREFRPGG